MTDIPEVEEREAFIRNRQHTLLINLAIHPMMDLDETQVLVESLIQSGRMEL